MLEQIAGPLQALFKAKNRLPARLRSQFSSQNAPAQRCNETLYHDKKDSALKSAFFHTIRHIFATRCTEAGFAIHADKPVTLGRYAHSSRKRKRANMDKLAAMGL